MGNKKLFTKNYINYLSNMSVRAISLKVKLFFLFMLFILVISGFSYLFISDKYKEITVNEQLLEEVNFILPYSYLIMSTARERGRINGFLAGNSDIKTVLDHVFKQRRLDVDDLPEPKGRLFGLYGKNIALIFDELERLENIKAQALDNPKNEPLRLKLFKQYSAVSEKLNSLSLIFKYREKNFKLTKLSDYWTLQKKMKETLAKERGLVYGLFFSKKASSEELSLLTFYRISQQELLKSLNVTSTSIDILSYQDIVDIVRFDKDFDEAETSLRAEEWWLYAAKRVALAHNLVKESVASIKEELSLNIKQSKQALTLFFIVWIFFFLIVMLVVYLIINKTTKQLIILEQNMQAIEIEGDNVELKPALSNDEVGRVISTLNKLIERNRSSVAELTLFEAVFLNLEQIIVITDKYRKIIFVNNAFEKTYSYCFDEIKGKNPKFLKSNKNDEEKYQKIWGELDSKDSFHTVVWNKTKAGKVLPVDLNVSVLKDSQQNIVNYIALSFDISERLESENKVWMLAHVDSLTGLFNRQYLLETLDKDLIKLKREKSFLALLFIDLDGFKLINDLQGHEGGDTLLKHVASQLKSSVREQDLVARLGGDEFVVVLYSLNNIEDVRKIAEKIISSVSTPINIGRVVSSVSASIGVSIHSSDKPTILVNDLIQQADTAMYRAKELGKNRVQFYEKSMQEKIVNMVKTHEELLKAVENNELRLFYQPVIELKTGRIIGAESLVRWQHPEKGLLFPDSFISIAEEMGSIIQLGTWVINESYDQGVKWIESSLFGDGEEFKINVNVSSKQCTDNFKGLLLHLRQIKDVIDKLNVTNFLQLEVTESMLLDDSENLIEQFNNIKNIGFKLLIDDFGTGYSSLSYIKKFPINKLKIDRAFIKDLETDKESEPLVTAIISMAHALNIEVVAEGVEEEYHHNLLSSLNCEYVQGYFYSKPLPVEEFEKMVIKQLNEGFKHEN